MQMTTSTPQPLKTIDLCAGIGGIRRGFELAGGFNNVLSAEIDEFAAQAYEHLYKVCPRNDVTSDEFKSRVKATPYDVLLAGFPCQSFSRMGLGEGFRNREKGQIFFHIADIIGNTRPQVVFLENVDHLITHDKGNTFSVIVDILTKKLNYYMVGTAVDKDGNIQYDTRDFIRNSRYFGVPQNRPRTYLICFNRDYYDLDKLKQLDGKSPTERSLPLYKDLNEVLEKEVSPKYYLSEGFLNTLYKHRARQEKNGNGFGCRVVNDPSIESPIANTLLATGGSGKERNLIYDPQPGIAGKKLKTKRSPLNSEGIRFMTPVEWGKLQGFVNYAFVDANGTDHFSFPDNISDTQKYKQFGNSVTVPTIETMAQYIHKCITQLSS